MQDYARGLYYPAAAQYQRMLQGGLGAITAFAHWKQRVRELWPGVQLRRMSDAPRELPRAGVLNLQIAATLNGLSAQDVCVEFVAQRVLPRYRTESPALSSFRGESDHVWRCALSTTGETDADGATLYALQATPPTAGQFAFELRIYPYHALLAHPLELGLLKRL